MQSAWTGKLNQKAQATPGYAKLPQNPENCAKWGLVEEETRSPGRCSLFCSVFSGPGPILVSPNHSIQDACSPM